MKKIGLVGGIGLASTVDYYLGLVQKSVNEQKTYPEIVIDSVNMLVHDDALNKKEYAKLAENLITSVQNLKAAGAKVAAITANTEHIVWELVCEKFPIPVISIVDVTVREVEKKGYKKVLLFGTELTMRSGLYEKALEKNGIQVVIPSDEDISTIGKLIYPNLENGIVIPEDQRGLIELANEYIEREKVDAMILGCTELALAIKPQDVRVDLLNTTQIHIEALYNSAIRNEVNGEYLEDN